MQKIIGFSTFLAAIQAADWNFAQHGADWPDIAGYEACGGKNQSPIDLKTDTSDYEIFGAPDDDFSEIYSNQYGMSVNWIGHTSRVPLGKDTDTGKMTTVNFFKSKLGNSQFGAPLTFEG